MIDFKRGLRHIGSFHLPDWSDVQEYGKKIELVNSLSRAGFVLFCNGCDVYQVDVYTKDEKGNGL